MGTQHYCSFEQAKRLTAVGFGWVCEKAYDDMHWCPTVALALKWLRDEKDLYGYVGKWFYFAYTRRLSKSLEWIYDKSNFDSYEESESALLDALLTEVENENSHG